MGTFASVPSSVTAVDPPRQIEWVGAHAPTELGQLLQYTGHLYCPYSGGGASIMKVGVGQIPPIPQTRLSSWVTASSVSRLPTNAILISAPNAEARTYNDQAGNAGPAWEFVVRDAANGYKWAELSTVAGLGGDPVKAMANDFPDAAEKDRKQLRDELYKVIRLKGDRYNRLQSPLLREVLMPDGTVDQPHLVAEVAVQDNDSAWFNRQARLNASTVDNATNMLAFDLRLGKVKTGTETAVLETNFEPIAAAQLKPTFTVEDWNGDDGKRFSVFGYTLGVGAGEMPEGAARARLQGFHPDTLIIDNPTLRAVYLNDDTNNRDTLAGQAAKAAGALLVGALTYIDGALAFKDATQNNTPIDRQITLQDGQRLMFVSASPVRREYNPGTQLAYPQCVSRYTTGIANHNSLTESAVYEQANGLLKSSVLSDAELNQSLAVKAGGRTFSMPYIGRFQNEGGSQTDHGAWPWRASDFDQANPQNRETYRYAFFLGQSQGGLWRLWCYDEFDKAQTIYLKYQFAAGLPDPNNWIDFDFTGDLPCCISRSQGDGAPIPGTCPDDEDDNDFA